MGSLVIRWAHKLSLHMYNITMTEKHERLKKITLYLEEEVLDAIKELQEEYSKETGKRWSKGAIIRVALSEFFTRQGRML